MYLMLQEENICGNPECLCEECTCDPCECSKENPCGCDDI